MLDGEIYGEAQTAGLDEKDIADRKAHSKSGTPVTRISKILKRTVEAVRQKAKSLAIGLGHRRL